MKIDTSSAAWQVTLAVVSAAIGVGVASGFGWLSASDRELTLFSNVARSDITGPGVWPDSKTKRITIHEYVLKNTGDVAFDTLRLRLSPEGGDAAYDNELVQRLQFAGVTTSQAIPGDVKMSRDHNAVIVDIKELQPSEEVGFTITNDGLADGYDASVLPANIELRVEERPDWRPVDFSELSLRVRIFIIFAGLAALAQFLWMLFDVFKHYSRKQRNA